MDRKILEKELDELLASMARVTISGAQQFTEKRRQFLMQVGDTIADQRTLLIEAAQSLNKPGATLAQQELRKRITAHLTADESAKGPAA